MKLMGGLLAPLARLPVTFLQVEKSVNWRFFISMKLTICAGEISLEDQVGKFYGTSIWCERALPVLSHIEPVEGSFRPDVLESDIGHIAGASGICLDESNIVALYDGNVASMLLSVSGFLLE